MIQTGTLIVELLQTLLWPLVLLFVILYFGKPLKGFVSNLGEFTFKAAGVEATVKRQQIEAATHLGAATGWHEAAEGMGQPQGGNVPEIANLITQTVTPENIRQLSDARVLWVDDIPENNVYERRALEAVGIRFVLSTTTEDALGKTLRSSYAAIISDMGRPPDHRAGYTLLDALRQRGDRTPFIIYAGSRSPEHNAEARKHGALGYTNRPQELFQLVVPAIVRGGETR